MENFHAVAVGYNFGLIPAEDLSEIKLNDVGAVRFEGKNLPLLKGQTYEDSRKLDALLDQYGEYPIKDYTIEPVIMAGQVEMVIPGFDKERDSFLWGGYAFVCDGKKIPVDFSGIGWDIDQTGDRVLVSFETGRTPLLTDWFLDDCYEADYQEAGLRINDITAEFLSKAMSISEFMVSLELNGKELDPEAIQKQGDFRITALTFSNEEKEYAVKQEVLNAFHTSLAAEKPSIDQQIGSAKNRQAASHPVSTAALEPSLEHE